jgi:1,4-dihydroxy-2-naphthoate octaprenyltransferase
VDAAVGKHTLATRWSPTRLRRVHLFCLGFSFSLLVALGGGVLPPLVAWAGLPSLPFAVRGTAWFTRRRSPFPTVAAMVVLAIV